MVKQARYKMTFDITEMSFATSERCEAHFVTKRETLYVATTKVPTESNLRSCNGAKLFLLDLRSHLISHKD
jgi:hypothetical protein